jgi:hypothetical protein
LLAEALSGVSPLTEASATTEDRMKELAGKAAFALADVKIARHG